MTGVKEVRPASFCLWCDAAEGECGHSAPRYLEPVKREQLTKLDGVPQGWKSTGPDSRQE